MEDYENREELTIKFAKGLAEAFTSKSGKELVRIKIPNIDPDDHSPWMSFVLPAKAVHENQYGKGLWAKIPADGTTTVSQSERRETEEGGHIWERLDTVLTNQQLKMLVENYKNRDERGADTGDGKSSVMKDLQEKKKTADEREGAWKKAGKDLEEELPFK